VMRLLLLLVRMRMLCRSTAVTVMLVAAAVAHVWVAPLGTVEAIVPLTVNVDEPSTVLRTERH